MTKFAMILMLTVTAFAATGCYARAGYYAGPMYLASTPAYVVPTAGYTRPYGYGYSYERPGVFVAPRPGYVEPRPVYRAPEYATRVVARPASYRVARASRGYRR